MPVPIVAVEVAPPASAVNAAVLAETCSTAVRRGRCELYAEGADEPAPAAIAIVSWVGESHRHARVQVGVRREARAQWATRDLYFEPSDPELERWRSVGLTIAILIGEIPETRALVAEPEVAEPSAPEPPPAPEPPVAAEPAKPPPAVAHRVPREVNATHPAPLPATPAANGFVGALATFGNGLDHGAWRRGASLWGAKSLSPLVPIWIPIRFAYAWRPREESLRVDWLSVGTGVAALWPLAGRRLALEAELTAGAEQLAASATNAKTGRQDSDQRWTPLFGAAAALNVALVPPFGVALVTRLAKPTRTFTLHDEGVVVARSAAWEAAVEVGPVLTFH